MIFLCYQLCHICMAVRLYPPTYLHNISSEKKRSVMVILSSFHSHAHIKFVSFLYFIVGHITQKSGHWRQWNFFSALVFPRWRFIYFFQLFLNFLTIYHSRHKDTKSALLPPYFFVTTFFSLLNSFIRRLNSIMETPNTYVYTF